jgi:hypothetical protein
MSLSTMRTLRDDELPTASAYDDERRLAARIQAVAHLMRSKRAKFGHVTPPPTRAQNFWRMQNFQTRPRLVGCCDDVPVIEARDLVDAVRAGADSKLGHCPWFQPMPTRSA